MDYDTFQQELVSPALRAVAAHWHQSRGANLMPQWSHLKPARIAHQLGIIWVYRFDRKTGQFTGRLAGNRITEGFGKSFRGTRLEDLHRPEALPRICQHLLRVVNEPALYRCTGLLFRKGTMRGFGERIMLPLGGEKADGIIGATDYELAPDPSHDDTLELIAENIRWFSPCQRARTAA